MRDFYFIPQPVTKIGNASLGLDLNILACSISYQNTFNLSYLSSLAQTLRVRICGSPFGPAGTGTTDREESWTSA
jgi:hypothetical protein